MEYKTQILIALCVYIGQITFGYGAGWPTYATIKMMEDDRFYQMTPDNINWIVSSVFIGCLVGASSVGFLSNVLGRKLCLTVAGVINVFSFLTLIFIRSPPLFIFIRIVKGIGICATTVLSILYLGEISSKEIRGMLLVGNGMFMNLGFLIMYCVGPYSSYEVINYVGVAISSAHLIAAVLLIPETPVFYILKGKFEEAKAILLRLGRAEDVEELTNKKNDTADTKNNWLQLLTVKSDRKALTITVCLLILQQFSGITPILIYSNKIFDIADSSVPPDIATILMGIANLVSGCVASLLVERFGRRFLMLFSSACTFLSLAIFSAYLYLYSINHPIAEKTKWIPMLTYIIYCVTFSVGFNVIPLTLVGEMFSLNVRSTGSSVTMFVNFTFGFVVITAFGYMVPTIGLWGAFTMFSVTCALTFIFTLLVVPETKGKSLIEVQKMLNK